MVALDETDAVLSTSGTLASVDVDNPDDTFIAQTNVAGQAKHLLRGVLHPLAEPMALFNTHRFHADDVVAAVDVEDLAGGVDLDGLLVRVHEPRERPPSMNHSIGNRFSSR